MKFLVWNSKKAFVKYALHPLRWYIGAQIVLTIVSSLWWPLNALLVKSLLNEITQYLAGASNLDYLCWLAVAICVYDIFIVALYRTRDVIIIVKDQWLKYQIPKVVLEYFFSASELFFQEKKLGTLANNISTLADSLLEVVNSFSYSLPYLFQFPVAIIIMWRINAYFGMLALAAVVTVTVLALLSSRKMGELSSVAAKRWAGVSGIVVDILANVSQVRNFTATDHENKIIDRVCRDAADKGLASGWYLFRYQVISQLLLVFLEGGLMFLLLMNLKSGLITVGDFALTLQMMMMFFNAFWYLPQEVGKILTHWGNVNQILDTLLTADRMEDSDGAKALSVRRGKIEFEGVTFGYQGKPLLFKNMSLQIHSGEKIGVVGKTGCGKSTFMNLILRIFDIKSGEVRIDDQNIAEVTQESLRKNLAIIPQNTSLFHRTIMDNIRYGKLDATDEEVYNAAKRAHIHDFIVSQPLGYQTMVGDHGANLSGGQRQRIGIARAILKNSPILLIDEATSALDSRTENIIQQNLEEVMRGRTTIAIAHRLSTLMSMDRILVFDAGIVVEEGTHDQLLEKGGIYKVMWDLQVNGMLNDGDSED